MAISTKGTAIPVALIGDLFASQFAFASQGGDIGAVNPFDCFDTSDDTLHPQPSPDVGTDARCAVVILNSLPVPLRLVDSYAGTAPVPAGAATAYDPAQFNETYYQSYDTGAQANYPAVSDRASQIVRAHEIPGVQTFPISQQHLLNKVPQLLRGVGAYTFTPSLQNGLVNGPAVYAQHGAPHIRRALSFSTSADGSGPLVAVAFRTKRHIYHGTDGQWPWSISTHSAVTADLLAKYTDLATFYESTMLTDDGYDQGPDPQSITSHSAGDISIWATFAKTAAKRGGDFKTITVWVRDRACKLTPTSGNET